MNKSLFLAPLFMAAFASCSNEDVAMESNGNEQTSGVSYLSVNIMNTTSGGGAGAKGIAKANEEFEYGIGQENKVERVRFYFFDVDGNSAIVKHNAITGKYESFLDYNTAETTDGTDDNIEKVINTTLVIQSPDGDQLPASIIAVVNPTIALQGTDITSIENLNEKVSETLTDEKANFMMSNSIYHVNGTKMEAVSVKGALRKTAEAAIAEPVIIHVERQAAKVRVENNVKANEYGVYPTSPADGKKNIFKDENGNPKEIFVKFLGWNTTTTAEKSYIMKSINTTWDEKIFADYGEPWNSVDYCRSYWAQNPKELYYKHFAFNSGFNPANAKEFFDMKDKENYKSFSYIHENADGATKNTKVIVAAQLCDEQGNPITVAEFLGFKYCLSDLKTAMLAQQPNIYKEVMIDGKPGRERLTVDDVKFVSAATIEGKDIETGRYWSYIQIIDTEAKYFAGKEESAKPLDATEVNEKLVKIGKAKVWNEGMTYYFFDIRHLGTKYDKETDTYGTGYYGVVRNHVYNAKVNTLVGLGTPVLDPDEVIYPEKPEGDETYIAAQINILAWRVVDQDVDLNW